MANAESNGADPTKPEQGQNWSPSKLTVLGFISFGLALALIVFMATRMTTCMYLDGSH
jgi:hypothetical protein